MASLPDTVPVLDDGVVRLRAHRESDLEAIVEQCSDSEMPRWTTVPVPYGRRQALEFLDHVRASWASLDEDRHRVWAIEARDDAGVARFAGTVDYRPEGGGLADTGFGLHPWARGRGVMARALRLALTHGFESDGLETVHWRAFVGNWASRRVAWSCGFRVEGTVRDLLTSPRGRHDGWIGTLRKGEPMQPPHVWLEPVVLEGDRIRLRPWRDEDAPRGDQALDAASRRFMPGFVPTAQTFPGWVERQRARMAEGEAVGWCIADRESDGPLGQVQCFRLGIPLTAGSGMLSYWLYPGARGGGVMAQAVELVSSHAFSPVEAGGLGLHRLEAGTDADNTASQRVLLRAGFTLVGTERQVMAHDGAPPTDGRMFELLAQTAPAAPAGQADPAARIRPAGPDAPVGAADPAAPPPRTPRLPMREPATLEGERVRLRAWRDTDADRVVQACSDPRTRRWLPRLPSPYTRDDAATYISSSSLDCLAGSKLPWCVADPATDECMGSIAVFGLSDGDVTAGEIGYWAHPQVRGRGVMREAVRLVTRHAFMPREAAGMGLRRLEILVAGGNEASQHVARSCGFVEVGRERQAEPLGDGTFDDLVRFDLLAGDCHPSTGH